MNCIPIALFPHKLFMYTYYPLNYFISDNYKIIV